MSDRVSGSARIKFISSNELRQKKHGIPTVSSESIGSLLKAKTADRTPEIHEQYKKSHNSYGISEKVNRNYTGFDSDKVYGESTGIVFIILNRPSGIDAWTSGPAGGLEIPKIENHTRT